MKTFTRIIAGFLAILLPFLLMLSAAFLTPAVYDETFVGALKTKTDRLNSVEGEKIVIVGGSSVAFGINSELIEKYTDMPVVNFGLYAALGTKIMIDLSKQGISKGDVVILAPEMDPQTLSLYFNADTALKATDGSPEILLHLDPDNFFSCFASSFRFATGKMKHIMAGTKASVDRTSAYAAEHINEYGDLDFTRQKNIMSTFYDTTTPIALDESVMSREFIDYINDYVDYCEKKGATVYFGFCPMNELAVQYTDEIKEGMSETEIRRLKTAYYDAFEEFLTDNLKCPLLGSVADNVMGPGYFYDSNFHLNDYGVMAHTVRFIKDLASEMDMNVKVTEVVPAEPVITADFDYDGPEDENCKYFTFKRDFNTTLGIELGYIVTGLTDLGKTQTNLTIPVAYNGIRVNVLGENALAGGITKKLILPKEFENFIPRNEKGDVLERGVFNFADNCLAGANNLTEIWLYDRYEATVKPTMTFGKSLEGITFYIPQGAAYNNGYDWGQLGITKWNDKTIKMN
ncbi:MAG: hypothetical protein MJ082_03665 [Clostridia bacterium]|nr:hypothetical protein [Clostridia bacterium]